MSTHAATTHTLTKQDLTDRPVPPPLKGLGAQFMMALRDNTLRNPWFIGGSIGIPVLMYFLFAVGKEYSDTSVGHANIQAAVLAGLTCYGALISAASATCNTALQRRTGWWRTLALTPMSLSTYLWAQICAAILVGALAALVTYGVGALTGAKMSGITWGVTFALSVVCSFPLAAVGFAVGQLVGENAAYFIVSMTVLVSAFLSGMFMPLEQMGSLVQKVAKYTPMYGIINLVRAPQLGWDTTFEWSWVINIAVWSLAMLAAAVWTFTRSSRTERN